MEMVPLREPGVPLMMEAHSCQWPPIKHGPTKEIQRVEKGHASDKYNDPIRSCLPLI